jgi:hypothetical protein
LVVVLSFRVGCVRLLCLDSPNNGLPDALFPMLSPPPLPILNLPPPPTIILVSSLKQLQDAQEQNLRLESKRRTEIELGKHKKDLGFGATLLLFS